jgi:hypothetical protein
MDSFIYTFFTPEERFSVSVGWETVGFSGSLDIVITMAAQTLALSVTVLKHPKNLPHASGV